MQRGFLFLRVFEGLSGAKSNACFNPHPQSHLRCAIRTVQLPILLMHVNLMDSLQSACLLGLQLFDVHMFGLITSSNPTFAK